MLDSFLRDAAADGMFLTSYLPADGKNPDYRLDSWHGTSHESDVPGCIHHNLSWIRDACGRRGLIVEELVTDRTYGQSWLSIRARARGGA